MRAASLYIPLALRPHACPCSLIATLAATVFSRTMSYVIAVTVWFSRILFYGFTLLLGPSCGKTRLFVYLAASTVAAKLVLSNFTNIVNATSKALIDALALGPAAMITDDGISCIMSMFN